MKLLEIFICALLVTYLTIAFVVWEMNPANWETEVRFIMAFGVPVISVYIDLITKKSKSIF